MPYRRVLARFNGKLKFPMFYENIFFFKPNTTLIVVTITYEFNRDVFRVSSLS